MKANDLFEDAKRLFVEGKWRESAEAFTKAAEAGYGQKISYLSRGAAYLKMTYSPRQACGVSKVIKTTDLCATVHTHLCALAL